MELHLLLTLVQHIYFMLVLKFIFSFVRIGFHKCLNFDAKSGIESLDIEPISRVAAEQRKGRAGRTKQGLI